MSDVCDPQAIKPIFAQDKTWIRKITRDRIFVTEKVRKLRRAISLRDDETAELHRKTLLTSVRPKRVAIADLINQGRHAGVASVTEVDAFCETLTAWKPTTEVVKVHAKEKASKNGYRLIFNFGGRHCVIHRMIGTVLECQYRKRRFQVFDRGVPLCIDRVLSQISEGYVYAAHLDIRNFYPTFEYQKLKQILSLDNSVIEAALTGRKMVLENASLPPGYPHTLNHLIKEARRGLPQGASTSPIAAHICLADLKVKDERLEQTFNYEDDFLVLAKTEAELHQQIEALRAAVGILPGGQFDLVSKNAVHLSEGLDFLGHHLSLKNGEPRAEPSEVNLVALAAKLQKLDGDVFSNASGKIAKDGLLEISANKLWLLKCWRAAFSACSKETKRWQYVEGIVDDIWAELELHGHSVADLQPPTNTSKTHIGKFHYYRWFD